MSYDPETYGDRIADVYDEWYGGAFDTAAAVQFLAGLAGEGPVLELGIGTGRLAIPLSQRGIEVWGIDASQKMIDVLRTKPGGDGINVSLGDFAGIEVDGEFSLEYVAFNTLFALTTQAEQVRCFRNVSETLLPDGLFVIECFVPDVTRFDDNQRVSVQRITDKEIYFETTRHDPVGQRNSSRQTVLSQDGIRIYPVEIRYAYPPELDLMAELAGMRLRERYAGWHREPFISSSRSHISVYEKAEA